jgi:hypothetical protein
MQDKHLWEIEHDYYCDDRELRGYNSWKKFIESDGSCDFNMNLLFRWDWNINDDGKNVLSLFWVLQRKGRLLSDEIIVNKSDEKDIIKWLNKRFDHIFKLWEPIS